MTTKAELRNLVLKELGVLPTGHTASAEDATEVEAAIDRVHRMLDGRDLLFWDENDVPVEVTTPMTVLVADDRANSFQIPAQRVQILMAKALQAIDEIRKQVLADPSDEPVEVKYY